MDTMTRNEPLTRTDIAFQAPTQVKFGVGKVSALAGEMQIEDDLSERTGIVVITDKALVDVGLLDRLRDGLADSSYEIRAVFDDVPSDSDVHAVEAAAAVVVEHAADLIIALGGGSVIDTAKAAAILATHGGRIHDYEGLYMVPGPCTPIVAVPTTCGTGSEVSAGAVVKDHEAKAKIILGSQYIFPRLAVLDPEMLQSLPDRLVAYTGMDAMTHAVEAFVSTDHEPFSEALALHAVEMLYDNLPEAVRDRSNLDALSKVQIAAAMAGVAFTNAVLGATHAISHSIGAVYGLHHGLSNAVALPYVMEYNLDTCPSRFAALARAMGAEATAADDEELAVLAVARVRALNLELGIPSSYTALGIADDSAAVAEIAEMAMNDPCLAFNPRPSEYADIEDLVRRCVAGL
jgi:alcohol dehydrogenase class IV